MADENYEDFIKRVRDDLKKEGTPPDAAAEVEKYLKQVRAELDKEGKPPVVSDAVKQFLAQMLSQLKKAAEPPPVSDEVRQYLTKVRTQNQRGRTGTRTEPAQAFRFYVEISGILRGEFLECSGLSMEREVQEIEEGGVNDYVHKLPGRIKYSNVTLKRGITYDRDLWDWFRSGFFDGRVRRVNISVIVGNAEGRKVKQWDLIAAYPVKWSGADLRTDAAEVAAESIEIAHHGIELGRVERDPLSGYAQYE